MRMKYITFLFFLCFIGKAGAQIEIDLSTIQDGSSPGGGCGVDQTNIYFERGGDFILTQSDPNTPTTRYIQAYQKCHITLKGVNIAVNRASYSAIKISGETTLTLAEGTVNRVKTTSNNAAAIDADSPLIIDGTGTLIVEAPLTSEKFNGIGIKTTKELTINGGIIQCNAAGDGIYIWNQLPYYKAKLALNGGVITTTGNNGIAAYSNEAESITALADEVKLATFGKSASVVNLVDSITDKMMRFAFTYTPATDVTLSIKDGETVVRTITVPVGNLYFAFNTPKDTKYTLWEGDNQLLSDAGDTEFAAGGSYNLKKNIEVVEIDLSTVTDGTYKGYTASEGLISLNGSDMNFVLNQSDATTPITRRISAEGNYDIELNGVNLSVAEGNAFTVAEGAAVNFLLNGGKTNRFQTMAEGSGLALEGDATINGLGTLIIDAPYATETAKGNGITVKKTLDINSGTIVCTATGNGINIVNGATDGRLSVKGGNITLTGENGIAAASATDESITALTGDETKITIYAKKASTVNIPESITAKMIRFAYAEAPTTDATVFVNSGTTVLNTLSIPADCQCFAFNAPEGAVYNLWQDDKLLKSDADVVDFATGGSYTGVVKKITIVEIDLSKNSNPTLNQRGTSYILNQSGEATVTGTITVTANCDVTFNNINIVGPNEGFNPIFTVENGNDVELIIPEGTTNQLKCVVGVAGIFLRGSLTINGEGTLMIDSPNKTKEGSGTGISGLNSLTINGTTIICNAYKIGISISQKCVINGAELILTGEEGISEMKELVISDDTKLTIFAKTDATLNIPEATLARMMSFTFVKASKEDTPVTVKDNGTEVRVLTVPANMKAFAFTAPAGATYTLWEGDAQLIDNANKTDFSTGNAYKGLDKKVVDGISVLDSQADHDVNLYTVDGKFIRTIRISDSKDAVKGLPKGVYVIEGEKIVK